MNFMSSNLAPGITENDLPGFNPDLENIVEDAVRSLKGAASLVEEAITMIDESDSSHDSDHNQAETIIYLIDDLIVDFEYKVSVPEVD